MADDEPRSVSVVDPSKRDSPSDGPAPRSLQCPICRYSLAGFEPGAAVVCPECGTRVNWAMAIHLGRPRRSPWPAIRIIAAPHIVAMLALLIDNRDFWMPRSKAAGLLVMATWFLSPFFGIAGLHRFWNGSETTTATQRAMTGICGALVGIVLCIVPPFACELLKQWVLG